MTRRHAQYVYVQAKRAFSDRSRTLLTNALNTRKWRPTVKPAVLGVNSSLPPLVDRGGRLLWSADQKASLFSAHFDATQCSNHF